MSKEIDTKIECCEIWNSLKDKTKMIDFLINAKTEIDQLKQENEKLFLQLSKQEIDEHKPVYCTLAGNDCKYLGKIKELKQQLAEKEKENGNLKQEINEWVGHKFVKLQYQKAIQELEKVKNYCDQQFNSWEDINFNETYDNKDVSHVYYDVGFVIQQQINALEGEKDVKD